MSGAIHGGDYASIDGNKAPDLPLTKTALRFLIVRGSYGAYIDSAFKRDYTSIKANGIVRGAYFAPQYPRPGTAALAPDIQAKAFAKIVGELDENDLPPAIDVEFNTDVHQETGLSPTEMIAWLDKAVTTLTDIYGFPPMIYTSARVFQEPLHGVLVPQWENCPLWVKTPYIVAARKRAIFNPTLTSPPKTPPSWKGQWWIDQYQGDALAVPGFTSTVDLNVFHVLRKGDTGPTVAWVNRRMGQYRPAPSDSVFDQALEDVVKNFQSVHGLTADGVIGPVTLCRIARCLGAEKVN